MFGGTSGANEYEISKKTKDRNWQEDASPLPCGEGNQEAREIALGVLQNGKTSPRLVLAQNGTSATRPALCYRITIFTSLHRLSDKMKLLKYLCLPKSYRRERSKARSEIGPIEGQSGAGLAVLRPTESAPDLRIGTSTVPAPSPLVLSNQESNGM